MSSAVLSASAADTVESILLNHRRRHQLDQVLSSSGDHQPQLNLNSNIDHDDEQDDELDEDDVEELLWSAQMNLIQHQSKSAISKLTKAANLGSSAACTTLANLLSTAYRDTHHHNHTHTAHDGGIEAAKLFIKGLELQLTKPRAPTKLDQADDEELSEGQYFRYERCLDLVVGLTDLYRLFIVRPADAPLYSTGHKLASQAISSAQLVKAAHRLVPTIRIHLLYILALVEFASEPDTALARWTEICRIAKTHHSVTKEGTLIAEKAQARLKAVEDEEADQEWRESKRRGKMKEQAVVSPGDYTNGIFWERKLAQSKIADAEEDLKSGLAKEETVDSSKTSGSSIPTSPPSTSARRDAFASVNALPRRGSKFHFAEESVDDEISGATTNYPSPPQTPPHASLATTSPSPPQSELSSHSTSTTPEPQFSRLRRKRDHSANSAFAPLSILPRVTSSASISTLPPDFFSSQARQHRHWQETFTPSLTTSSASISTSTSAFVALDNPLTAPPTPSWFSRQGSHLNPFRREPSGHRASAIRALQGVLKKDDAMNEKMGIVFLDADELAAAEATADEDEGEQEDPPTDPSGQTQTATFVIRSDEQDEAIAAAGIPSRPRLVHQNRSFVDPTSTIRAKRHGRGRPFSAFTPIDHLSNPTTPAGGVAIDPLLLELEKKSRVGARTKCGSCGKKGLNFPACPRCKATYCSRECRINQGTGGDGVRHVCA